MMPVSVHAVAVAYAAGPSALAFVTYRRSLALSTVPDTEPRSKRRYVLTLGTASVPRPVDAP